MILYEYEGKQLLQQSGIAVPTAQLISSPEDVITIKAPCVLKAQLLSGKRAQAGGIVVVEEDSQIKPELEAMFGKVINKEKVEKILIEEKAEISQEFYLSLSYDTDSRSPILTYSESGGTGIEDKKSTSTKIDQLEMSTDCPQDLDRETVRKMIELFFTQDCTLLEINPLVKTTEGKWMALDAKVKLDDSAAARHEDWHFPPRGVPGYTATHNEIEAKKIDEGDYRGTAGSAYFDIEGGDIAVLSSGGGVSLTAMDTLISFGGKPANFTEYSGNPPKEKVTKLTKIVLNKPNIHGLWVIGTVAANFTDIYETLSGLIEGLKEAEKELGRKFDFPIVIRRGGPREDEAFEMLKQVKDFDLHLQGEETSIVQSAQIMTDLAINYASHS